MTPTQIEQEAKWAKELYESRVKLRDEVRAALACRTKKQNLVQRWKSEYSPTSVDTMLRIARNKSTAGEIANWDINKL